MSGGRVDGQPGGWLVGGGGGSGGFKVGWA